MRGLFLLLIPGIARGQAIGWNDWDQPGIAVAPRRTVVDSGLAASDRLKNFNAAIRRDLAEDKRPSHALIAAGIGGIVGAIVGVRHGRAIDRACGSECGGPRGLTPVTDGILFGLVGATIGAAVGWYWPVGDP
jgi:hypothetical protein